MANETLTWEYEAIDKTSDPLAQMDRALGRTNNAIRDLDRAFRELNSHSRSAGSGMGGIGQSMGGASSAASDLTSGLGLQIVKWEMLIDLAKEAAEALGHIAFGFAEDTVEALSFRENATAMFKTVLGDAKAGKRMFEEATLFGKYTPFETKNVVDSYKNLLGAGFTKQEIPIVFQAVGDVGALSGDRAEQVMEQVSRAFGAIKSRGAFDMMEFNRVMTDASGIIRRQDVLGNLAKMMNIGVNEVADALRAKTISSDEGIFAILKAIQDMEGGHLGQAMVDQAKTLTGVWSNLKSMKWDQLFLSQDKDLGGYDTLKNALLNLQAALLEKAPAMQKALQGIMNDAAQLFFHDATKNNLGDLIDAGIKGAQWLWEGIKDLTLGAQAFWDTLKPFLAEFGTAFTDAGGGMDGFKDLMILLGVMAGKAIGILLELAEVPWKIKAAFDDLPSTFFNLGTSIGNGLTKGLEAAVSMAEGAAVSMAGQVAGGFAGFMGIRSPSKLFEEYGANTAEGYVLGVGGGADESASAVQAMVGRPQLPSFTQPAAPNVTIQVTVEGGHGGVPEEIGRAVAERVNATLADMFRQYQLEVGLG